MSLQRSESLGGRAVEALLADQRMLLITILLGNITANVLYFIISSVLMMRSGIGAIGQMVMAAVFLLVIVLTGEVGPKMLANTSRLRFAALCSPLLLTMHRVIGPLRAVLDFGVIAPLSRLTAPRAAPPALDDEELDALLEVSDSEGVISADEHRILRDVLAMRRMNVRDVMTPRVRMVALPRDAQRDEVLAAVRDSRRTKIPIYEGDLEHILGVLHVKRYLLDPHAESVTDSAVLSEAKYVPDIATLDQLLDHFRRWRTQSAIVIDEYGGTEGIVSLEDVVEELIGDIISAGDEQIEPPRLIGLSRWRVSGDMSARKWAEAFKIDLDGARAATLGGLIIEKLGRPAQKGDVVEIGAARIEVEAVEGARVVFAVVTLDVNAQDDGDDREEAPR